jgi:flagellar hook-length control protein FliK
MMMFRCTTPPASADAFKVPQAGPDVRTADRGREDIRPARSFQECLETERKVDQKPVRGNERETKTDSGEVSGRKPLEQKEAKAVKKESVEEQHPQRDAKDSGPVKDRAAEAKRAARAVDKSEIRTASLDAVKERLIEGIVALMAKAPSAQTAGSGASDASLESLKGELRRSGTAELKDLFDRMRSEGRPSETLKDWLSASKTKVFAGAKPDAGLMGDKTQRNGSFRDAFLLDPDSDKVAVNRTRIKIMDRRNDAGGSETSDRSFGGNRIAGAAADKAAVQPETLRKDQGAVKSFDQFLGRDNTVRAQTTAETKSAPVVDVSRTNQAFNELARHARLMLEDKKSVMELELRPAHLGRLTLKIELMNDRVTASLMAQSDSAGDMLRQNMGDLYQAFREAGFDMSRLNVNVGFGKEGQTGQNETVPDGTASAIAAADGTGEDIVRTEAPWADAWMNDQRAPQMMRIDALV